MQPRSDDRFILYLAAWLEAMEEEDDQAEVGRGVLMPAGVPSRAEPRESPAGQKERKLSRITPRAVLDHPLLLRGSSGCIPKLESKQASKQASKYVRSFPEKKRGTGIHAQLK